jgi:hypothetical protein
VSSRNSPAGAKALEDPVVRRVLSILYIDYKITGVGRMSRDKLYFVTGLDFEALGRAVALLETEGLVETSTRLPGTFDWVTISPVGVQRNQEGPKPAV